MSQPNIDYMMNMAKEFLSGKIDGIAYTLDFPYELEQRYKKMHREDDDYCELIYECLYEEGIALYNELSDADFKKLIRKLKNQKENPFTEEGHQIYFKRTKKKRKNARLEEILTEKTSMLIGKGMTDKYYNFEYYMNQAYALNQDKVKCRYCGKWLYLGTVYTHRINPHLPINKVSNLASMDKDCFELVKNATANINHLEIEIRKRIETFRKRLGNSHGKNSCIDGTSYDGKLSRTV